MFEERDDMVVVIGEFIVKEVLFCIVEEVGVVVIYVFYGDVEVNGCFFEVVGSGVVIFVCKEDMILDINGKGILVGEWFEFECKIWLVMFE